MGHSDYIIDSYYVFYKGTRIGCYRSIYDGTYKYESYGCENEALKKELAALNLDHSMNNSKDPIAFFEEIIRLGVRVPDTRKFICRGGPDMQIVLERERRVIDNFWIYRSWAKEGESGYSPLGHVWDGENYSESATKYVFNKYNDGTFEVELEVTYRNGHHDIGGPCYADIPEDWFSLSYDEFLNNVIKLAYAYCYNFSVEDLKAQENLRFFFGFE